MTGCTVQQTIEASIQILQDNNVIEPEPSTFHLLAASLDLTWESGYRDLQRSFGSSNNDLSRQALTKSQAKDYKVKLQRRLKHEPLQYILGQWDFLDYTIAVRPPLLCPRPETEELVMKIVQETTESPIHILDVGCGTGVIGLALAEQLADATVEAIDIDPVAVSTSMENAKRILDVSEQSCYHASLCSAADYDPSHHFDIVVSNPPYIPKADMATLSQDVVGFENDQALCGGDDGMDVIRTIIEKLPLWCNAGAECWMEVDPTHPAMIREWLESNPTSSNSSSLGVAFEAGYQDMFGKDRFVKLRVL